jgi:hypothetical protein
MDPQVQASFIPKKPLQASVVRPAGRAGLLWLLALLIFFASAIAGGGAFLYQSYLQSSIKSQSQQLAQAQAAYDPNVINDIIRLNSRMLQAQIVLRNHLAPSSIFTFLEQNTLKTVRFTSFDYSNSPSGAQITLDGEAVDFPSVALQSDAFGQNQALKNVLFSNVNVDPATGHVVFQVTATLNPTMLLYSTLVSSGAASSDSAQSSAASSQTSQTSSSQTQTPTQAPVLQQPPQNPVNANGVPNALLGTSTSH